MNDREQYLSEDETRVLNLATGAGTMTAQIYRDGVFSEPDFVLLGVLQRLAIRGRLAFLGLSDDRDNAAYSYALTADQAYAPELARNAA